MSQFQNPAQYTVHNSSSFWHKNRHVSAICTVESTPYILTVSNTWLTVLINAQHSIHSLNFQSGNYVITEWFNPRYGTLEVAAYPSLSWKKKTWHLSSMMHIHLPLVYPKASPWTVPNSSDHHSPNQTVNNSLKTPRFIKKKWHFLTHQVQRSLYVSKIPHIQLLSLHSFFLSQACLIGQRGKRQYVPLALKSVDGGNPAGSALYYPS